MDPRLLEAIRDDSPDTNTTITRGLVNQQMRMAEHYIHLHLQQASKDFPPQVRYKGEIRPCSPEYLFARLTHTSQNDKTARPKRGYEVDRNSFYLVELVFEYLGPQGELNPGEGEEMTFPIYMPYMESNGLFYMRDKAYNFIPVLFDPGFSYTQEQNKIGIFVDVYRIRYKFSYTKRRLLVGDKIDHVNVVNGKLHYSSSNKPARHPDPALGVYLFTQHGVVETFQRFAGIKPLIGGEELDHIDSERYVLFRSRELVKQRRGKQTLAPPILRLAIPRDGLTERAKNLAGTLFYYADAYPHRILPEYLDGTENERHLWLILLGKSLKAEVTSEPTLAAETLDHIHSIKNSITPLVTEEFHSRGIEVNCMDDLFYFIIDKLGCQGMVSHSELATLYGKRLVGLKNPLTPITKGIYQTLYNLQRQAKDRGELNEQQVRRIIYNNLKPDVIREIIKSENAHQEMQLAGSVSDNRYMGLHCVTITQEEVKKSRSRGEGIKLDDPKRSLHASIAEVGSYTNLPKKNPTGRTRLNPFVNVGLDGIIHRKEHLAELIDQVQRIIDNK